jgi:hypothetical protein
MLLWNPSETHATVDRRELVFPEVATIGFHGKTVTRMGTDKGLDRVTTLFPQRNLPYLFKITPPPIE